MRCSMPAFGSLPILAAALAGPAQAEEALTYAAATAAPAIVVTGHYAPESTTSATKTETPLIDIPQSLSIVGREQIDDQALTDIGDILRYTPGASAGQGEGNRDQFTIRGQNTTADFYIDGLRDDVQYFRPLYNLERVEILRGPNALIFGRGGGGGVINRVTKTARLDERFAAAAVGVDTFGAAYLSTDINVSGSEVFGFRLNGFYEHLANHRDFFGGERFAINPTATLALGPSTSLVASYEIVDDDRVTDRGIPSLGGAPLGGVTDTFFGSPRANVTTLQANIARARFDHRFNDSLSFNTAVQYADYDKLYQNIFPVGFDGAANAVSLDGYRDTTQRENFIVQGNLVWNGATGPIGHMLLLGYEYGDQQSGNARRDILFSTSMDDIVVLPFSDPLAIPSFSFPRFNRQSASDVEFLSFYAQDQIAIGDHLQIVAGLRYDRFSIDVTDAIEVADGAGDGNDGLFARTDNQWSPRIGVIVKPVENLSFYASFARSFLPRSGDQFLNLTPSNEALAPERFDSYELGVKWGPLPGFDVSAAVFRLDNENGTTADPNNPGDTILTGSRTEGIELQLAGEIRPGWVINAGYSYLDADERGRVAGAALANRRLAQVPEHMASLWSRVNVIRRLGLGGGVTYQSSQFAAIDNSVRIPGYTRVDAALFYDVTDNVSVQLNVENLFDTAYFPAAHNNNNISTGEPLNARLTLRARF